MSLNGLVTLRTTKYFVTKENSQVQPTVDDSFATLAYIDSGNDVGN
jgi:hypothetical protein